MRFWRVRGNKKRDTHFQDAPRETKSNLLADWRLIGFGGILVLVRQWLDYHCFAAWAWPRRQQPFFVGQNIDDPVTNFELVAVGGNVQLAGDGQQALLHG